MPRDIEKLRAAKRKYYEEHKEEYVQRVRDARLAQRKWLSELKSSTPCMDCGRSYPYYVMDFDHRDPTQKKQDIGRLANGSWPLLRAEVAKCDIVCANCHRERTHAPHAAFT